AAALGGHPRVAEDELLVQPLADEIDLGAVHLRQAGGVHPHRHALALEDDVVRAGGGGDVHHVGEAGTAGGAHPETQADAARGLGQVAADAFGGGGGQ